jgi:hypothetical protein
MNLKKYLENHIRGWLPKEPHLPTMQLENKPKKFFTKRNILLISVGIIIAMLLSGAIFFIAFINLLPFPDQTQEARNTVKAYVNALNDYNATAAWDLMSPNMQASYGTIQNFTDSFVSQLQESGWHAQLVKNNFEYGTIAEWSLIPFQNACRIVADIAITRNNSPLTNGTFTFDLKTYAFGHFQPSDWKINNKFTGS